MDHLETRAVSYPADSTARALSLQSKFFIVLALYFSFQIILRLITSNTADLDESEQLVMTQQWAWGYGPQPPLFTWLQIPFFKIFGPSILGLSLFKNLLLFGTYLLTYLNAQRVTRDPLLAVLAAVSLLFVPQIAWESQRDLTHSVLVTVLAAATFYVLLCLSENKQSRFYFVFGLCIGLGTLANYSFLVFLAGLVAALSMRSLRSVVLNRGMLLALGIAVVLVSPHVLWAFQHPDTVFATAHKFNVKSGSAGIGIILGTLVGRLGRAILNHVGPLLAVYFVTCWRRLPTAPSQATEFDLARLIARSYVVIFLLLMLTVVCLHVTGFKDRWFLPVFICLPVLMAALFQSRLSVARIKRLLFLGGLVAAAVLIAMPARIWLAERLHRTEPLNAPFAELTTELRPQLAHTDCLIAEDFVVGGNLRLCFSGKMVFTPRFHRLPDARAGAECVLVWDATRAGSPPETLINFASRFAEIDLTEANIHYVEATLKFHHAKRMRLGLVFGKMKQSGSSSQVTGVLAVRSP